MLSNLDQPLQGLLALDVLASALVLSCGLVSLCKCLRTEGAESRVAESLAGEADAVGKERGEVVSVAD